VPRAKQIPPASPGAPGALHAFLPALGEGRPLAEAEVAQAVALLLDAQTPDADRAAFLVALARKGETAEELASFTRALLPHARPVARPAVDQPLLDCCGTGGGGIPLFNVSTAIIFLLAAAGVPVVKHGNRGVTKPSGSADVIEALGLKVELTPEEVGRSLAELGFAFLYAPHYFPAFRILAPARRLAAEQGSRTVFNLLGPLLNPLRPETRLVGVFSDAHVALYHQALCQTGSLRHAVVCGRAGRPIGEVSPTGNNLFAGIDDHGAIARYFDPGTFEEPLAAYHVADAAQSAALIERLLVNPSAAGWGRALLVANAGVALTVQGRTASVAEGLALADEVLQSGAAAAKLAEARAWSRGR
jgi:anthranilate phosphoribosyltransferase